MHPNPLPPLPKQIGSYAIEKLLNRGGTSLVYLAKEPHTDKKVVIKVVLPKFLKNKEMMARLFREANILKLATHPNIVKLLDIGDWEGSLFVAMDYVPSISLRKFILTQKFSTQKALEILLQIAYGVAHLHGHGIIHRDLKPENILITDSGDVKLIDFGIAQCIEEPGLLEQTRFKKRRMGTPSYMSPEQAETPEKTSYASDIFSLGLIASELFLKKLNYGVLHIASLPEKFRKIIAKAVQIDPSLRYEDIIDFIADITAYKKTFEQEEESSSPISDWLKNHLQSFLAPKKPSHWGEAEIGLAYEGTFAKTVHFFPVTPVEWMILFLEPQIITPTSLLFLVVLKGALLTLEAQTFAPKDLLLRLNEILILEKAPHYRASCLLLNGEKGLLSFASCQGGSFWHHAQGAKEGHFLETPNPCLGEQKLSDILEIKDNWETDSLLVMTMSQSPLVVSKGLESLAAQPFAENLLKNHPEIKAVVAIFR